MWRLGTPEGTPKPPPIPTTSIRIATAWGFESCWLHPDKSGQLLVLKSADVMVDIVVPDRSCTALCFYANWEEELGVFMKAREF